MRRAADGAKIGKQNAAAGEICGGSNRESEPQKKVGAERTRNRNRDEEKF